MIPALLFVFGGVAYVASFFIKRRGSMAGCVAVGIVGTGLIGVGVFISQRPAEETVGELLLEDLRPVQVAADGYVSSETCRDCHPNQHQSWHSSYHRTMTQIASADSVIGDFDDVHAEALGKSYHLTNDGDEFKFSITDSTASADDSNNAIKNVVAMTTGSHHMQVYWYPSGLGRSLKQLPIVYLMEDKRWIPEASSFLQPPGESTRKEAGLWNQSCIHCHATHGRPRYEFAIPNVGVAMDTQVGEFGISCEACHGPGEAHVKLRRAAELNASANKSIDDPIINPARLDHRRSAQVCGRCHSVNQPKNDIDLKQSNQTGFAFRPGQLLDETLDLIHPDERTIRKQMTAGNKSRNAVIQSFDHHFWRDGAVRVVGREFNGLNQSACYQKGEMSCVTCHLMHKPDEDTRSLEEWRNDQLKVESMSDGSCLKCHEADTYQKSEHTHHLADSGGSRCMNCHMPHTTFGLMKTINSHTIDSPNTTVDLKSGRLNACNLCHLDQSLKWTADRLSEWYGIEPPKLIEEHSRMSVAARLAVSGDAGQRAIVAWHMGWNESAKAANNDWFAPYLGNLLDDPYDIVRLMAFRSLKKLPDYANLEYDFIGPSDERANAARKVMSEWTLKSNDDSDRNSRLLVTEDGKLNLEKFGQLKALRNDRPVNLVE